MNQDTHTEGLATTVNQAHEQGQVIQSDRWMTKIIVGLVSIAVLLLIVLAVGSFVSYQTKVTLKQSLAVVDIEEAVDLRRMQYLKIVRDPNATPEQLEAANVYIKDSAALINRVLGDMAAECQCLLLLRPALLQHEQSGVRDLTADLVQRVASQSGALDVGGGRP